MKPRSQRPGSKHYYYCGGLRGGWGDVNQNLCPECQHRAVFGAPPEARGSLISAFLVYYNKLLLQGPDLVPFGAPEPPVPRSPTPVPVGPTIDSAGRPRRKPQGPDKPSPCRQQPRLKPGQQEAQHTSRATRPHRSLQASSILHTAPSCFIPWRWPLLPSMRQAWAPIVFNCREAMLSHFDGASPQMAAVLNGCQEPGSILEIWASRARPLLPGRRVSFKPRRPGEHLPPAGAAASKGPE